ncbi:Ankyrin repeat domain-containing protein 55, partial [Lamellibrachia satsuma]
DTSMDGCESELAPAHQAAADGDMDTLTRVIQTDPVLLECTDSEGYVPLAHAVMAEKLDSVKLLLKMGASVNRQDNMGRTCLAMAAYQ